MPLELSPTRKISDRAQTQRVLTRLLSVCAGLLLVITFAAAKGWLPKELTGLAFTALVLILILAAWSGLRSRQLALADREKESGRSMIVAIAAQLGRQDDATLDQISAKGGPAAEAARVILAERRHRASRSAR